MDDSKYKFIARPSEGLKCAICSKVAKSPQQHGHCGKLFCRECLDRYGRHKPCKNCKATNPQYFVDNKSELCNYSALEVCNLAIQK